MKFCHIADCHIGSWREPKLREASLNAFVRAVDRCIEENADFVLISGDLFNTSMPPMDCLKIAVSKLRELKESSIPLYIIAGSHDLSASGRTMVDVLDSAGLAINVARGSSGDDGKLRLNFTEDKKTGAKIAGMIGKKGGLEKEFYSLLSREALENENGYKIFMFHSAITELKPKELEKMDSAPVSLLPKNFDYYAGGHVHIISESSFEHRKNIVFPGPLFPNSFSELEKLQSGGFYIVENNVPRYEQIVIHPVHSITIICDGKNPEDVEAEIIGHAKNMEFINTIVTIRLEGTLKTGRPSDINFREMFRKFYEKEAFLVLKNSGRLASREFDEVMVEAGSGSVAEIEQRLISENTGRSGIFQKQDEMRITEALMRALAEEKLEGETSAEFEKRIKSAAGSVLSGSIK